MKDGLTLLFVRHGETDWNATRRYQGQTDIPLNERGRLQARRNGEALRGFLQAEKARGAAAGLSDFDLVASPLGRARETMEIMLAQAATNGPPPLYRLEPRLKELSYGSWEGKLQADLPVLDPEGFAARAIDRFHWRPKGGESYADLQIRVRDWLSGVRENSIIVAHGGVSRCLEAEARGLPDSDIPDLPCPQDRILLIRGRSIKWL